jgi:hypothetical protein
MVDNSDSSRTESKI